MTVEIERDRWDRPLIPQPDGGPALGYTRVTTISEVQADRYNLEKWLQRQVLVGAVKDPTIMPLATVAGDDKRALNKLVDDAHAAAKSGEKAEKGTALHDILYRLASGTPCDIPPQWARHVAEWRKVFDQWDVVCLEQMVIHDTHRYAGTPDLVAVVPGVSATQPIIVDYKTGSTIDFGFREMAAQLAMYANADWLWEHDDGLERRAMPDVSKAKGMIVHLPENGGGALRLYQIDLVAGWKAAKRSMEIREWQKTKLHELTKIVVHGDPVEEWLRRRIMRLATIPDAATLLVSQMRPEFGTLGTQLDLTYEDEMVQVLDSIEDRFQLSFAERHPLAPTWGRKKTAT